MNRETLVIGVDGYLGGAFFDQVKNTGENVTGTSLEVKGIAEKLGIIRHDLTDKDGTVKLISRRKPDVIADFVGIASPAEVKNNPELAWKLNVGGVENIIRGVLATRYLDNSYDPVILVVGSVEEFGDSKTIVNEETPFAPKNTYGEHKVAADIMAMKLAQENDLKLYWILQGNAIGGPDRNDSENPVILRHGQSPGFFVPDVAKQIAELEKSSVRQGEIKTGYISHQRNLIHFEDAVKAYRAIAETKPAPGRYIVAADKSIALDEVLKMLISYSFIDIIHVLDESRGKPGKDRFYSNEKIKNATGWTPTTTLEKALKLALEDQRQKIR